MPRPKSDLTRVTFWLSPDDLDRLDVIAERFHYRVEAGKQVGSLNRTEAVRKAIAELAKKISKNREKSEGKPL